MTPPTAIEVVPVMWVFWAWSVVTLAFFANGVATCRLNLPPLSREPAADARFFSERESESKFRDTYRKRFAWSELAYLLLVNGAGGFLLYFADAGIVWAVAFFALVCLWLIYDCASTPFTLREMHPKLVGTLDWVYFPSGAIAWAYCLVCIGSRWLGKL